MCKTACKIGSQQQHQHNSHPACPAACLQMRTDFWPTLIAEVSIWPVVQAINFAKVPLKHQLLVVNAFTTLDAAFMSWARNREDWFGRLLEQLKAGSEGTGAAKVAAADKGAKGR